MKTTMKTIYRDTDGTVSFHWMQMQNYSPSDASAWIEIIDGEVGVTSPPCGYLQSESTQPTISNLLYGATFSVSEKGNFCFGASAGNGPWDGDKRATVWEGKISGELQTCGRKYNVCSRLHIALAGKIQL